MKSHRSSYTLLLHSIQCVRRLPSLFALFCFATFSPLLACASFYSMVFFTIIVIMMILVLMAMVAIYYFSFISKIFLHRLSRSSSSCSIGSIGIRGVSLGCRPCTHIASAYSYLCSKLHSFYLANFSSVLIIYYCGIVLFFSSFLTINLMRL